MPFNETEETGLPRISDINLNGDSACVDILNQIHKISSHLFRSSTDQIKVEDDEPVGNFDFINLTIRYAVVERIKISSVPRWRTNNAEKRIIAIILGIPRRPVHDQLRHE